MVSEMKPRLGSQIWKAPVTFKALETVRFQIPGMGSLKRMKTIWLPVAVLTMLEKTVISVCSTRNRMTFSSSVEEGSGSTTSPVGEMKPTR